MSLTVATPAQAAHDFAGTWEGPIKLNGCARTPTWKATIVEEGATLRIQFSALGEVQQERELSPGDSSTFSASIKIGTWTFNGTFRRGNPSTVTGTVTDSDTLPPGVELPPGACEVKGTWEGTRTQPGGAKQHESSTPTETQDDAESPGPSTQTETAGRELAGPQKVDLGAGERMDVGRGGRVTLNGMNINVDFGRVRVNLTRFPCPRGYEPAPGPTLSTWIGARCRTITTPHAAALVRGTEILVEVSADQTTFRVLEGTLEVSDLARSKVVAIGPNQEATTTGGGVPTDPTPFDPTTLDRWWEGSGWLPLASLLGVGAALLAAGALFAVSLRSRRRLAPGGAADLPAATNGVWRRRKVAVAAVGALVVIAIAVGTVVASVGGNPIQNRPGEATSKRAGEPLLPPRPLTPRKGPFSIKLSWQPPVEGPAPLVYRVYRDGRLLARVSGTRLTDNDVSPGHSYTYELEALGAGDAVSPRAVIQVETPVPAPSQARLSGTWLVTWTYVEENLSDRTVGEKVDLLWTFEPACGAGPCRDVAVRVDCCNGSTSQGTLTRSGATYRTTFPALSLLFCGEPPMPSTASITVTVKKGRVVLGEWLASRFTGEIRVYAPPSGGCSETALTAKLRGRPSS